MDLQIIFKPFFLLYTRNMGKELRDKMKFGWINLSGAVIVIAMLVPNLLYAIKNRNFSNKCTNKVLNFFEQIGRYGCIILMWLPVLFGSLRFQMYTCLLFILWEMVFFCFYISFSGYYTLIDKVRKLP